MVPTLIVVIRQGGPDGDGAEGGGDGGRDGKRAN